MQYLTIAGYIGETPTHGHDRPSAERPLPTGWFPGGSLVVGSRLTIRIREPAPVTTASPNPAGAVSIDSRSGGKHRSLRDSGPPREPANNSAAAGVANIGAFAIPVHLPLSAGVDDPTDRASALAFYEEVTRHDD